MPPLSRNGGWSLPETISALNTGMVTVFSCIETLPIVASAQFINSVLVTFIILFELTVCVIWDWERSEQAAGRGRRWIRRWRASRFRPLRWSVRLDGFRQTSSGTPFSHRTQITSNLCSRAYDTTHTTAKIDRRTRYAPLPLRSEVTRPHLVHRLDQKTSLVAPKCRNGTSFS